MDTTLADAEIEALIQECALHLNTLETYVVSCETLDVDCHKAKLPDGFVELLCIKPTSDNCTGACSCVTNYDPETDESPTSLTCGCYGYYVANRSLLTEFCGMGQSACSTAGLYEIQNGYIRLSTAITSDEITIYYRGWNQDEDGIMLIDEFQERGLSAYAAYQYANSGQNYKSYQPQQVALWQREANAQINKIRGRSAKMDHKAHLPSFAAIVQAIITNPSRILNTNP